jgi:hypothetical protein
VLGPELFAEARRSISALRRSMALVDEIERQWSAGNVR